MLAHTTKGQPGKETRMPDPRVTGKDNGGQGQAQMKTRARTGRDKLWARMGRDKDELGQKRAGHQLIQVSPRLGRLNEMAQVQSEVSPLHGRPGL